MTYHSIYFPDDLHSKVEAKRGSLPRSRFIQNALRAYLNSDSRIAKETVRGEVSQDHCPITKAVQGVMTAP